MLLESYTTPNNSALPQMQAAKRKNHKKFPDFVSCSSSCLLEMIHSTQSVASGTDHRLD